MTDSKQRVVVVHRGARDAYQVSAALAEAGLLEQLVTDLYWPNDRRWASRASAAASPALRRMLLNRYHPGLPSSLVSQSVFSGLASFLLEKLSAVPFSLRRQAIRWTDSTLGRKAGRMASRRNSLLLSYSYYGYQAFQNYRKPGILFQLHPHPLSVRRILSQELADHPDCAMSLGKEWELSLPQSDFERLVEETKMAAHFLVASSFTRDTLVENGTPREAIRVIPYGVDSARFHPDPSRTVSSGPLRLLFVGSINQRKGIKYLLEALRLVGPRQVELTVCGRVVDDLAIFKPFGSQVQIRPSVSFPELLAAYRQADLFVFPSVAEGFAQVLLESLACGLPILSTTHTAAPDLIDEGVEGFVVPTRRPDLLAARIEWALTHRSQLAQMRSAARQKAEQFTPARFRAGVVDSILAFQGHKQKTPEGVAQYV